MTSISSYSPIWESLNQREYTQQTVGQFQNVDRYTLSNGESVAVSGHAFDQPDTSSDGSHNGLSYGKVIQSSEDFVATLAMMQNAEPQNLATADFASAKYYHVETDGPADLALNSISHSRWLSLEDAKINDVGLPEIIVTDPASMDRMERMLQAEKELKLEYGEDIKIAYDNHREGIVMLTPGDIGYDKTLSGQDALANLRRALASPGDFDRARAQQILDRYAT